MLLLTQYGIVTPVKGPFDNDSEAEAEKAEYSEGGKRDSAIAKLVTIQWDFDF